MVAAAIQEAFPDAKPVFTYLANDIRVAESDEKAGVPFSMVASIDFDGSFQPVSAISGDPIGPLDDREIVLNQWASEDLGAKVGDSIELTFFEPESKGGPKCPV